MPTVLCPDGKKKQFPYTKEGRKAAQAHAKKFGCKVVNTPKRDYKSGGKGEKYKY